MRTSTWASATSTSVCAADWWACAISGPRSRPRAIGAPGTALHPGCGRRPRAAGRILTAPGGYPSRSWGRDGYATFIDNPAAARPVVQRLAADGVDLIKVALDPGEAAWPVLSPAILAAVVSAAHDTGLPVVAHAVRTEMVRRAVDAGVDE